MSQTARRQLEARFTYLAPLLCSWRTAISACAPGIEGASCTDPALHLTCETASFGNLRRCLEGSCICGHATCALTTARLLMRTPSLEAFFLWSGLRSTASQSYRSLAASSLPAQRIMTVARFALPEQSISFCSILLSTIAAVARLEAQFMLQTPIFTAQDVFFSTLLLKGGAEFFLFVTGFWFPLCGTAWRRAPLHRLLGGA
mmetsp:Transcript_5131/g.13117  ORF Transcript_5131/g.13117 Transcript_5131/m.13117 type:complete len:202 (+) Transcript_5131:1716-2321(+)